VYFFLMLK